ncbi:hypothetical protein PLIIFM63780_010284 [Purpureocillium lilacinum]|nr:hypothetical protein PLIIFM63780_010284 [Purpureocillium lilacinum]
MRAAHVQTNRLQELECNAQLPPHEVRVPSKCHEVFNAASRITFIVVWVILLGIALVGYVVIGVIHASNIPGKMVLFRVGLIKDLPTTAFLISDTLISAVVVGAILVSAILISIILVSVVCASRWITSDRQMIQIKVQQPYSCI